MLTLVFWIQLGFMGFISSTCRLAIAICRTDEMIEIMLEIN
jgi:hypothetical protein